MRSHALAARSFALEFLERSQQGGVSAPDELLGAIKYYAFLLTLRIDDCMELVRLFPQVESLLPGALREQIGYDVDRSVELLEHFSGR